MSAGADDPMGCDPQAAADFLRALAHPMRLQILCRLLDGEAAVATFESELGLKQPNLSQQLGLLRETGLVTTRREAKSIFYSLADQKVGGVLAALRDAFTTAAQPKARRTPKAGQRPIILAAEASARPKSKELPQPNTECGMFSVAGWNINPTSGRPASR